MARFERRCFGEERPLELPWARLNGLHGGGLYPGLHVVVGGTGSGRSQFGLQAALHAARAGVITIYVALELGHDDIAARVLGELAGLRWSDVLYGNYGDRASAELARAAETLRRLPLTIDFGGPHRWDASTLRDEIAALASERGPGTASNIGASAFVVIDFLQIVGSHADTSFREPRDRIARAAYAARELARTGDVVVMAISSVAREAYPIVGGDRIRSFVHKDGVLSDVHQLVGLGKECGEIEYAADSVTLVCSWADQLPEERAGEGSREVIFAIPKLRAGPAGWTSLRFNGSRFADPADGGERLWSSIAQKKLKAKEERERKPKGRRKSATAGLNT